MKIVIIGGGVGGCGSALEFAEAGHEVILVEKRSSLLSGSSDDTPCRLGLGFHYIDINTAKKYLHATIALLKKYPITKYPNLIIAQEKDQLHPYRRWRYFIVKDSQFPLEKIKEVYSELQKEYERLVDEDPANKVLGEPENFYRDLDGLEYEQTINTDFVQAGIETAEQVLNWPVFKEFIVSQVENHPKITVYKDTNIIDVSHSAEHSGFILTSKSFETGTLYTDFIINCAWENVEAINHKLGFFMPAESRTNRLKVIVEIELPEEFEQNGPINSIFFCFGPHCSFTNLGNGKGFISYEPVTNIEASTGLNLPEKSNRLLYGNATSKEIKQYSMDILDGVIKYIPGLAGSKIISAKFGIVKTKGKVDIYSSNSDFHRRDYSGVEEQQIGLISNSCMKLLYFQPNAEETIELFDAQLNLNRTINDFILVKQKDSQNKVVLHALTKNLQRYLLGSENDNLEKNIEQVGNSFNQKNILLNEFRNKY